MKLDCYSFDLYRERMGKCHTLLFVYPPHTLTHISQRKKPGFEIWMFALMSPLFLTYPYVPGKDRRNNNQASYFVSTHLILHSCNFIEKETLAQVLSCEVCEIFKNIFFTKPLWTTASEHNKWMYYNQDGCFTQVSSNKQIIQWLFLLMFIFNIVDFHLMVFFYFLVICKENKYNF